MTENQYVVKKFIVNLIKVLYNKNLFIKAEVSNNLGGWHSLGYTLIHDGVSAKDTLLQIIDNEEADIDWGWDTYGCPTHITYKVGDQVFEDIDAAWNAVWNTQSVEI